MLNVIINKKYDGSYKINHRQTTQRKNGHVPTKETLITPAQNIIGEKQNERNEEWYDQECREIIEAKQEARLICIQRNARANQEEYKRKRIAAARVCRRKKREVVKRKADEIDHHTKNESNITQEFKK